MARVILVRWLQLINLIREQWPSLNVGLRNTSFGGDMRSLHVSFEKIQRILKFTPQVDLRQGIAELYQALNSHWIYNPAEARYRNHPPLLV